MMETNMLKLKIEKGTNVSYSFLGSQPITMYQTINSLNKIEENVFLLYNTNDNNNYLLKLLYGNNTIIIIDN